MSHRQALCLFLFELRKEVFNLIALKALIALTLHPMTDSPI